MTACAAVPAPPFCPNPLCAFHTGATTSWRWKRDGFHPRGPDRRRVQRYRCGHCKRSFSDQTFACTYWLRRPELLIETFEALVHGTGFRQLARKHRCSPQTVQLHAARVGRHCVLFHELHRPKEPPQEALCLDGLRNFEYSQYHPSEMLLVIGAQSHYTYGFEHAELRRMGTMRSSQKRKRARLERDHGRPSPRAIRDGVVRVLGAVAGPADALVVHSDEHHDYPRAFARLGRLGITHRTVSSRATRTSRNPLFAVNLMDLLARHCVASMRRETIAFSKTIASAVLRMWVLVVWRNHCKWFSERRGGGTPAMRVGIASRRLRAAEVMGRRIFPTRVTLPELWAAHYGMWLPTRMVPRARMHRAKYAA